MREGCETVDQHDIIVYCIRKLFMLKHLGRYTVKPLINGPIGMTHFECIIDAVYMLHFLHPASINNVVWSLVQDLQICKLRSYLLGIIIAMVPLMLVNSFLKSRFCCQLHYQTLKVKFYVVKIRFLPK